MPHSLPIVSTLASALGLALVLGFIAIRLKLPAIVGYLIAGILLGPFTPGYVADTKIAAEFAEIGVMLLMFGVGLHFSLEELLATRKIALPGALIQIVAATLLGVLIAKFWGWNIGGALIFGLALSVASTVVLIKTLEGQGLLQSINGQIAIGWLIVEDLAMVLVLVFLPFIAQWLGGVTTGDKNLWFILGGTVLKIASFVIVMLLIGRWLLPKILWQIARTGSRELFTLCVIAAAVSIAYGASKLFDVSLALGAFFAGMIIRESQFSRRAAEESLPFRDAFAVLFFVSVGMLFNPYIFIEQPIQVLIVVSIIIFGKSLAATLLVLILRYPLHTALTVSASLAQIGEFSFILAGQGVHLQLLPKEGQELILAGALLSIALNPLLFTAIAPIERWLCYVFPKLNNIDQGQVALNEIPKSKSGKIVLVGYGQVGKRIAKTLDEVGINYVVIDRERYLIQELREQNITAVLGNASEPYVLIQADIAQADMLVVATADIFDVRMMLSSARKINPSIEIAIRAQDEEELRLLKREFEATYFLGKEELAKAMGQYIIEKFSRTH